MIQRHGSHRATSPRALTRASERDIAARWAFDGFCTPRRSKIFLMRTDVLASDEVQAMARRQFGALVVVGLAFFAVTALIGVRASQVAPSETTARHATMQPETRHLDIAQPNPGRSTRG